MLQWCECLSHFGKTPAKSMTLEMRLSSPLTPSTWTESVLHTQLQKERKKNPNNYQIPRSVASRGGGWRDSRNSGPISRQRQQREQSSGVQEPRPEVLSVRGPPSPVQSPWELLSMLSPCHAAQSSLAQPQSASLLLGAEAKPAPLLPGLPLLRASRHW